MAKTLENSLGYTHKTFSAEYIPVDQINFYLLAGFYWDGGKLSKQHFDASDLNIRILKMFTKKMVLHLRDPRDVLLSWVHHMNFVKKQGLDLFYFDPQPPAGYYNLSFSEQIDWNIENFLPNSIDWINKWLKVKEQEDLSEDGLNILITTHDELVKDELGLYSKILSFYGIPSNQLKFEPAKKNDEVRFRQGTKGEWHTALTERQKKRVSEIIPDSLLKKV